jgi:ferredoxin
MFPQLEDLLNYEFSQKGPRIESINRVKERVLLGAHPCDLNGIFLLDQVFAEKNKDENYLGKRAATTIIGVDCLKPCSPESICLRMGGLDPRGRFDLFLTDLGAAYFAEAATTKGEKLIRELGKEAQKTDLAKLKAIRKKRDALFNKEQKKLSARLADLPKIMKNNLHHPEWEERGKKCYSCGACNAVCPTCYCFDVQDYTHISLLKGTRQRLWDGCMLCEFAKVASGENFREHRSERIRHRTYRKLYYLFEKWGESFCTGCGRCIKACLTKIVSPLEIANALAKKGKK